MSPTTVPTIAGAVPPVGRSCVRTRIADAGSVLPARPTPTEKESYTHIPVLPAEDGRLFINSSGVQLYNFAFPATTAVSILLFTEASMPSGIFLKKMPP